MYLKSLTYVIYIIYIMNGYDFQKRKTKKYKAKRNFELYGKFTPKHIRQQEELQRQHIKRIDNNINLTNTDSSDNTHINNTNSSKKKK